MNTLIRIADWFKQAVPEPTDKSRAVQLGCHLEEIAEMAEALEDIELTKEISSAADDYKATPSLSDLYGPSHRVDRIALLDSLADQIVTAIGLGHMFDLDVLGALAEVDRSNWSKFVDGKPQFDTNGKITKPATYSPPNLAPFV